MNISRRESTNLPKLKINNLARSDGEDADVVVGVSGEEGVSISGPAERDGGNGLRLASSGDDILGLEILNDNLGLQIPDLDRLLGGSAQPVTVGGEDQSVDGITGGERVQVLALLEIPQHGNSVLSSGSAERSIRGDGDGVQISSVSDEVGAELAVGQVPDLDELIPTTRDDQGVLGRGGEANARNPFGVRLILDGELALSKGVPQLDGLITRSRNDLTVVSGEGNRQNVLGVSDEAAGGVSGGDLPQTESSVPRSRQGELSVRRDNNVLDVVSVSLEGSLRASVVALLAGEGPDHQGLITRSRHDHVLGFTGGVGGGSNGGDPSVVSLKNSSQTQSLRHNKK